MMTKLNVLRFSLMTVLCVISASAAEAAGESQPLNKQEVIQTMRAHGWRPSSVSDPAQLVFIRQSDDRVVHWQWLVVNSIKKTSVRWVQEIDCSKHTSVMLTRQNCSDAYGRQCSAPVPTGDTPVRHEGGTMAERLESISCKPVNS